jgi:hypothetical protein
MRQSRQKAFLLLLVTAIGCSETTSPKLPATFELVNVNGRPLPTYFAATPGLTSTVLSAYLTLQTDGSAFWFETRRNEAGVVTTITHDFDYTISDGRIEVGSFGPCVDCTGTYKGDVSKDALSLVVAAFGAGSVIYNYRTTVNIPVDQL